MASALQPSPDLISSPLRLYLPPAGSDPVVVVCIRESHARPVTFTKHPVEQGSPITDHARPEPAQVSLDCMASRTPVGQGYTDADALWQQLNDLQDSPALIDAETIGGFYVNMGVANVTRAIDVKTANAVAFTLTIEAIRQVRNKLTRTVRTRDPKGQQVKKAGQGSTTAVEKDVDPLRRILPKSLGGT